MFRTVFNLFTSNLSSDTKVDDKPRDSNSNKLLANQFIVAGYEDFRKEFSRRNKEQGEEKNIQFIKKLNPNANVKPGAIELAFVKPTSFDQLKQLTIKALESVSKELGISLAGIANSELPFEFQVAYREFLIKVADSKKRNTDTHIMTILRRGEKTYKLEYPLSYLSPEKSKQPVSQLGVFLQGEPVFNDMRVLTMTLGFACDRELVANAADRKDYYFDLLRRLIVSDFEIFMKYTSPAHYAPDLVGSIDAFQTIIKNLKEASDPQAFSSVYLSALESFKQIERKLGSYSALYFLVRPIRDESLEISYRTRHLSVLTAVYQSANKKDEAALDSPRSSLV